MLVLITGGTGFVGSWVAKSLADRGHQVVVTTRSQPPPSFRRIVGAHNESIEVAALDLNNSDLIRSVFSRNTFDAVVHAAVVTGMTADFEKRQPLPLLQTNVISTAAVTHEAGRAGVRRVIYVGSPAVLPSGPLDAPLLFEETASKPTSLYGISKLAGELVSGRLAETFGMEYAAVRIAQPFGPGEVRTPSRPITSPLHEWMEAARAGDRIVVPSWAAGKDWTYVKDTGRGIALVTTTKELRRRTYNLGIGRVVAVSEVVAAIRSVYREVRVEIERRPEHVNPSIHPSTLRPALSITRIRDEIGFTPEWELADAIPDFARWLDG